MSNPNNPGGISRRNLVKSSAIGGLALAAGGISLPFAVRRAAASVADALSAGGRVRQGGVNSDPAFRSGNMSVKR